MSRARLYLLASAAWVGLFVLAVANGAVRVVVIEPLLGTAAQPLSGISGTLLLGTAAALFAHRAQPDLGDAAVIGALWLAATLATEAAMIAAAGRPVADLRHALSPEALADGNLFVLMAVVMAAAPVTVAWLTRRRAA